MSDLWKQYEGDLVDNRFPLQQFLGNTNHSAVFLTRLDEPGAPKAAIKFISADIPAPDQQLSIWSRAAQLGHPQLLRIFHHGRCRIGGMNLLYVVMEGADENLSQFLPLRPLNAEETRDVLNPLVDALVYLHGNGFAHCHVKPSNLLAIADQLKLSSDTILPIGEAREAYRDRDIYDAPESFISSTFTSSTPEDVWSLGVTLVETLTQHAPPLPFDDSLDPVVPESLPQPFLEIARNALLRNPDRRWSISQIEAHLNPAPVAVAATASASLSAPAAIQSSSAASIAATPPRPAPLPPAVHPSPLSVPLSLEPAVPLAKLPLPKASSPRSEIASYPDSSAGLPGYVIPVVLVALMIVGGYFLLPKYFHRADDSSVSSAASSAAPTGLPPAPVVSSPAATSTPPTSASNTAPLDPPKSDTALTKAAEPQPTHDPARRAETAPTPGDLGAKSTEPVTPAETTPATLSPVSGGGGEVLDQVLPHPSASALATIHGVVHVVVRVKVDPAGNVSSADLESPGPSKYFADQAQRAAQQWKFASPASDGHSQPSQWQIRFEFTHSGVRATPTQIPH
jgi:TonB family protein